MFLDIVRIVTISLFALTVIAAAVLSYLDDNYEERMRKKYPDIFQKKDKIEMTEQTFIKPLERKMSDLEHQMDEIISKLDYYSPRAKEEKKRTCRLAESIYRYCGKTQKVFLS